VAEAQGDYRRAVELYEESAAVFRALGDDYAVAAALDNLGKWPTTTATTHERQSSLQRT